MGEKSNASPYRIKLPNYLIHKEGEVMEKIQMFTTTANIAEQQNIVKELPKFIKNDEDAKFMADLFSIIFLSVDPKHPLKKTVTRVILLLNGALVAKSLSVQIMCLITDCEHKDKFVKHAKGNDVIFSLTSCFNNFPPGVDAVSETINLVFIFTCNHFLTSLRYLYLENEMDKQKLHLYIYNATKFLVALLNQCDISSHMPQLSYKLLLASYKIIGDDQFSFNVKSNCGILMVMAAVHGPDNEDRVNGSLHSILRFEDQAMGTVIGESLMISKNYTAKICLFSGILNIVPHEIICDDVLDDQPAPIYIFQSLLDSAKKHTGQPVEILEISRTFILLSKLLFNMKFSHIEVVFKPTLDYIWTHLEHFLDTVRHDTIVVLKNTVKIAVIHEKEGKPSLIDLIIDYLSEVLDNGNTNFKALPIISNEATCRYLTERIPNLPNRLMKHFKSNLQSQQICTVYELLMEQYAKEIPDGWKDLWLKSVVALIKESSGGHVMFYWYQKIFQIAFKIDNSVIKLLTYDHRTSSPAALSVLLGCYILARKHDFKVAFHDEAIASTLWNGMVAYDLFDMLMCHQNSEIRMQTLSLIVESQKSTATYPEWDLYFLVNFLHYNVTTQLPNMRTQIVHMYKRAFLRYKESLRALRKTVAYLESKMSTFRISQKKFGELKKQEEYYRQFVRDLFNKVLIRGLLTDANYNRRSLCLELMLWLATSIASEEFNCLWRPEHVKLLYESLTDTYENNLIFSMRLLTLLPKDIVYYQDADELKCQILTSISMAKFIKPTITTTAGYQLCVYMKSPQAYEAMKKILPGPPSRILKTDDAPLMLLKYLMFKIRESVFFANEDLVQAAKHRSIYGLLFCMRMVIQKGLIAEKHPELVSVVIELCKQASDIVSPIVNNSSPEGYLPVDGEDIGDDTATSQMILVYAWRAIKEISLLLGNFSFEDLKRNSDTFETNIKDIADYFIAIFMETKHRGAYEQAYIGFSKFCVKLWTSESEYAEWPVKWLDTILDVICGKTDTFNNVCSTRRSAGIPFMVQAILAAEPVTRNHDSFHHCMKALLKFAQDSTETNEITATHSMNILRALYKHNQLGELVTPYVGQGVMLAVLGFGHQVWGVRNSSTLLFSALMMRMFGVQRTRDDEELSMKNRLSARVFFMRYPDLYDFILEKLQTFTVGRETESISLYPILLILARLYPSVNKSEMLQYLPYINNCLGSSICIMRELAAQASISVIPIENYSEHITRLLKDLSERIDGNLLHGKLLQLKLLVKDIPVYVHNLDIANPLMKTFWLMESAGIETSHMAATVYTEIVTICITKFKGQCHGRTEFIQLMETILETMKTIGIGEMSTCKTAFELTRFTLYLQLFANVMDLPMECREKFIMQNIMHALYSPVESLQIYALNCILYMFQGNPLLRLEVPDDESDRSELEYTFVQSLPNEMKLLMAADIIQDLTRVDILTDLFRILHTRSREYAVRVCKILPQFPCAINQIRPKYVPALLSRQVILNFLITETVRADNELFCSLLPIISTHVFKTLEKNEKLEFNCLIETVLKPYADPEHTIEERMSVCEFIVKNARLLHDKDVIGVKDIVEIWYIVLKLLQDCDMDIRNRMSKVTQNIKLTKPKLKRKFLSDVSVIPEKGIEDLLHNMPELITYNEAMRMYLDLALKKPNANTITMSNTNEVFDKGEFNIFEEVTPVAYLAADCVKLRLWGLDYNLNYKERTIFREEHALLATAQLFNLLHGYSNSATRNEEKFMGMLLLKEAIGFLEKHPINSSEFEDDFHGFLEAKFRSIFKQTLNVYKMCRVEELLLHFFDMD